MGEEEKFYEKLRLDATFYPQDSRTLISMTKEKIPVTEKSERPQFSEVNIQIKKKKRKEKPEIIVDIEPKKIDPKLNKKEISKIDDDKKINAPKIVHKKQNPKIIYDDEKINVPKIDTKINKKEILKIDNDDKKINARKVVPKKQNPKIIDDNKKINVPKIDTKINKKEISKIDDSKINAKINVPKIDDTQIIVSKIDKKIHKQIHGAKGEDFRIEGEPGYLSDSTVFSQYSAVSRLGPGFDLELVCIKFLLYFFDSFFLEDEISC